MNPELRKLQRQIDVLQKRMDALNAASTIPLNVNQAFRKRFEIDRFPRVNQNTAQGLSNAPLATIADPAGGATVDSQARTAIGTIIDRLQALGLIS